MRQVSEMKEETQQKIYMGLIDLWCYLACIYDAVWNCVIFRRAGEFSLLELSGVDFLQTIVSLFEGAPDYSEISNRIDNDLTEVAMRTVDDLTEVAVREETSNNIAYAVCRRAIEYFDHIHKEVERRVDVRLEEYKLMPDVLTEKSKIFTSDFPRDEGAYVIIPLQIGYYLYRIGRLGELLELEDSKCFAVLHFEQVQRFGFEQQYTLLVRSELLEHEEILFFLFSLLPRELVKIVTSYDVAREKSVTDRLFTMPEFQ